MGEPLTRIMGIIFFALITLLPHSSAADIPWDSGTEDLFWAPNADISSVGSSSDIPDLITEYSPEADYSVDALGSSLAYWDENQAQNLPVDDISGGDLLLISSACQDVSIETEDNFDDYQESSFSIETGDLLSNYYPEDDQAFQTEDLLSNYYPEDDQAFHTEDLLAENFFEDDQLYQIHDLSADSYTEDGFSIDIFDPSASVANAEDLIHVTGLSRLKSKRSVSYDLDPYTHPETKTKDAVAADGTSLEPKVCPRGKQKVCCVPNTVPPFSQCWVFSMGNPHVCQKAKSLACCKSVTRSGGEGIECQEGQWIKKGSARKNPSQIDRWFPFELQDAFPILQPIPEQPDRSPGYCPSQ